MSDLDVRLAAALGDDAPPGRDPLFRLDVLARIERKRLQRRILASSAIVLVVAAFVAIYSQTIDTWIASDPQQAGIVGLVALLALLGLPGMPAAAAPGVRAIVKGFERWFSG